VFHLACFEIRYFGINMNNIWRTTNWITWRN